MIADRVHVSNHWMLFQALAHSPVQNFAINRLCTVIISISGLYKCSKEPIDLTTVIFLRELCQQTQNLSENLPQEVCGFKMA